MSETSETTTEQTATGDGVTTEKQAATTEATTNAETTATTTSEPVVYADFTPPEGITMDTTVVGAFSAKAAALGLTQEQAQGIIDAVAPVIAQQTIAGRDALLATYAEQVKADPELGGINQDKNIAIAKRALNTFATPALKELLEQGMGSNPEVIRMFLRIGKGMKEDTLVTGDGSGNIDTSQLSAVERLKIARRQ